MAASIYLDDTLDTIRFEKDALEIKFRHNISQLASNNVQLTALMRQLVQQ